jgi:hypothetical protein
MKLFQCFIALCLLRLIIEIIPNDQILHSGINRLLMQFQEYFDKLKTNYYEKRNNK